MTTWHEELLNLLVAPAVSPDRAFAAIERVACDLGFDYVAYGYQEAYPVTKPRVVMINNYPGAWVDHYARQCYLYSDPSVIHGKKSQVPLLWSREAFSSNLALWSDVQDQGIRAGWAQSSLESSGAGSMLTLCRCEDTLNGDELQRKESQMRWLVQVAHVSLSRAIWSHDAQSPADLTPREREVLQWTADGKSAQDIADILTLSKSAVDFHLANSIRKLKVPNKTAAVARAALQGRLH